MRNANTQLTSNRPAKNPKRVAAGIRNRAKRRGLTPAGRERLRQAALRHRPWTHSTGPTSVAGKATAAANGKRRQLGPVSVRALRRELAGLNELVRGITDARELAAGRRRE